MQLKKIIKKYGWSEEVALGCSVEKVALEISLNSQGNTCARVSFLIKLQVSACNFVKKETLALFCDFCKICKDTFSYRTPAVAASTNLNLNDQF